MRGRIALTCHQCGAAGSDGTGGEVSIFDSVDVLLPSNIRVWFFLEYKKEVLLLMLLPLWLALRLALCLFRKSNNNGGTTVVLLAI